MAVTRTVGRATLVALDDGAGPFFQPRRRAFPAATADHWRRADALDPAAVTTAGEWWLRFRCFAIRLDDGQVVLVDAGIGPADSPAASWAPVPGRLPEELAAAGLDPDAVASVVLTHLHTDHVGWAVTSASEQSSDASDAAGIAAVPYFRNARYLLQRAEHAAVDELNPSLRKRLIDPLAATGQLSLVDGDTTLAGPVRVVATPGHTPGHQSVLLDTGDETVLVSGDLLVHAVQLVDPALPYALETDPEAARRSRTTLLDALTGRGGVLATAHLGEPFLAFTPSGWAPAPPR
jgi:glyoxylase-like metal-dependent hydrolase (beta-lactamase superfamily II)